MRANLGRAQYNWIFLLPRNDLSGAVVQTGKYRSFVTFDEPFCSAALGHAESPWAQHVQLQGLRKHGYGFWFYTHLADQNASEQLFCPLALSAPLL